MGLAQKKRHEYTADELISALQAFQGETLDWAWADEEAPIDIYTELLTRTNVGNGPVWMTETPLLGISEVVRRFLHEKSPDRYVQMMTIEDVDHFSVEEKQRVIRSTRLKPALKGFRF